jgi:hypothetical protein
MPALGRSEYSGHGRNFIRFIHRRVAHAIIENTALPDEILRKPAIAWSGTMSLHVNNLLMNALDRDSRKAALARFLKRASGEDQEIREEHRLAA